MARADQIPRQWRILKRLEAHRFGLTANDLAEAEDCPIRTIYRDLADLEEAGFPMVQEKRGARSMWKLAFQRNSPQIPFEFSEIYALWLSRSLMKLLEGTEFYESICSVFEKVRSTLTPGILEHLEQFESRVVVRQNRGQDTSRFSEFIPLINKALEENETVEMTYFSPESNENTKRLVNPYRLWIQDGVMYLIGYCHLRKDVRTFNLSRLRALVLAGEHFEEDAGFDLEAYLAGGFRTMTGEVMDIEIRFDQRVRHVAEERIWHDTQELIEQPDGSVILRFKASGFKEIKSWVLSFGPKVEVLAPLSLRDAIRQDLLEAAKRYESA
jgi:predicted DNA-binding transcriptional regulator YafY